MFTEQEKINYIKENIEKKSRKEIMEYLSLKFQTINMIMRKNNIVDDRVYRYCPLCGIKIYHKNKENRIKTENLKCSCIECKCKIQREKNMGELNPFYGKHHSEKNKELYKKIHKGKRYSINTEFKKGQIFTNKKSIQEYWVKKYGEKIANEKMIIWKNKLSEANKGEKNSMYGKPSPIGTGNGWSGWYNNWYFRSLLELSYMIFIIERFNLNWENGEKKKNRIPYVKGNNNKNYFPDFIINKKYVIEFKPKKLWGTEENKLKFFYGKKYCEKNGLIFKVVDIYKIKKEELINLYKYGKIKFTKKYEIKINEIILNNKIFKKLL